MTNDFLNKISNGRYEDAEQSIKYLSTEQRNQFLLECATDSGSLAIYTFVWFLIIRGETASLHYCAAGLLNNSFCYLKGSYSAALFHARRAAELLPGDISCKEELLNYFGLPEEVMDKTEAKKIALEILQQDPTSVIALSVIKKIDLGF